MLEVILVATKLSENIAMTNFKTEKVVQGGTPTGSLRTSLWRNEGGTWRIFFTKELRFNPNTVLVT